MILEQYREFYARDMCKKDPEACGWIKNEILKSKKFAERQSTERGESEAFWHQVGLIYEQMEGITQGMLLLLSFNHELEQWRKIVPKGFSV